MRRKKQQKPNYYNFNSIFFHIHFFGIILMCVGLLVCSSSSAIHMAYPIAIHAFVCQYDCMRLVHTIWWKNTIQYTFGWVFSLFRIGIYRENEWNVDKIKLSFVIATYHEANAQAHTMQLRKWLPRWQWERKRKMLHEAAVLRKWNWTFVIVTNSN